MGDIIELSGGQRVPADARLIKVHGLRAHEAALTGESADVAKQVSTLQSKTPLANRVNIVFMGTSVVNGSGEAVVIATGTRTEYGKIAQVLRGQPEVATPLRRKLQKSSLHIGALIALVISLLIIINIVQGKSLVETFHTAVTLLVSAIPEDLSMILTIALTVGVVKILRRGGIVRELGSAETLGAATVICVDKTGTLTEGNMVAKQLDFLNGRMLDKNHPPKNHFEEEALVGLVLASDAHRSAPDKKEYIGSETERSALAFAESLGINQRELQDKWRLKDGIAFNSHWKYRAVLCDHPRLATQALFVTGAPDILLERSSESLNEAGEIATISSKRRFELHKKIVEQSALGHRLLAVAVRRSLSQDSIIDSDVHNLTFLGALTIQDPVRSEVAAAIQSTHTAGIAVKIVTGDASATAQSVARQVGLTVRADTVMEGTQIEEMTDAELEKIGGE